MVCVVSGANRRKAAICGPGSQLGVIGFWFKEQDLGMECRSFLGLAKMYLEFRRMRRHHSNH